MGRRYGRNQKRKHLKAIEDLSSLVSRQHKMTTYWRRQYHHLEREIYRFARYSILLTAKQLSVPTKEDKAFIAEMQNLVPNIMDENAPIESFMGYTKRELSVIRVLGRHNKLQDDLHIRVLSPDGEIGYAVSGQMFYENPTVDFVDYLTKEISYQITRFISDRRGI